MSGGVGIHEGGWISWGWVSKEGGSIGMLGDGYPRERVGMSGGVGIHEGGWISWGMGIQGGREHRYAGVGI